MLCFIKKEAIKLTYKEPTTSVLVIDDEACIRQSMVTYLEDSGFRVLEAENGQQGVKVFTEKKPQLVLTDLQMPVMNGLGVLQQIREKSPDTPVIVVSAAGGMNDVIEALRAGAWDYIPKPQTDMAVLGHAIRQALERSRLHAENKLYSETLERNLKVLEEDQKAGTTVQQQLLPDKTWSFQNHVFQHHIVPSLYLSGDFVDYFPIDENHVGFYLADVSGHGVSSAFVTVWLKSHMSQLQAFQNKHDSVLLNPNQLLEAISGKLYQAKLGKYLTMVYGVINTKENQLNYAIAGHFPNPILVTEGQANYLDGRGFPVGIKSETTFDNHTLSLPESFQLILLSDGVLECLPKIRSVDEQTAKILSVAQSKTETPALLLKALAVHTEKALPDDVTVLMLSTKH